MKKALSIMLILLTLVTLCACDNIYTKEKAESAIKKEVHRRLFDAHAEGGATVETVTRIGPGQWEATGTITASRDNTSYSGTFEATIDGKTVEVVSDVISKVERAETQDTLNELKQEAAEYFNW